MGSANKEDGDLLPLQMTVFRIAIVMPVEMLRHA